MKLYNVLTAVAVSALVSSTAFAASSGGGSHVSQIGGAAGIYATGADCESPNCWAAETGGLDVRRMRCRRTFRHQPNLVPQLLIPADSACLKLISSGIVMSKVKDMELLSTETFAGTLV